MPPIDIKNNKRTTYNRSPSHNKNQSSPELSPMLHHHFSHHSNKMGSPGSPPTSRGSSTGTISSPGKRKLQRTGSMRFRSPTAALSSSMSGSSPLGSSGQSQRFHHDYNITDSSSPLSRSPQQPSMAQIRQMASKYKFGKKSLSNSPYRPQNRRDKLTQRTRRSNSIPSLKKTLEERGMKDLSHSVISQLKHLYNLLDTNKTNFITHSDIKQAFQVLGIEYSQELIDHMISDFNTKNNDNSGLELDDFIEMCVKLRIVDNNRVKTYSDEDERAANEALFHIFDASSKDGRLTDHEMRDRLEEITGKNFAMRDVQRMMEEIDEDSDNLLSLSEFLDLMDYLKKKREAEEREMQKLEE